MTWQTFYKKVTGAFHEAGPFYSGPGHHGVDFAVAAHGDVPSYFTGTCVLNGHSEALGNYTVLKRSDGKYVGYAHCLIGTRPDIGQHVKPGDILYKAAGKGDDHGDSWTGPHCHTTLSGWETGIYDGRTVDPWPSIKAAIAPKPATPAKTVSVTIKKGDTLTKVAAKYKTTVKAVMALNHILDEDKIYVGQKVRVK